MSRKKTILLAFFAVLLAISEVITPMTVSMMIDRSLNRAAPSDKLGVVTQSFPGLSMWLGRFDSVQAGAEGVNIDGLKVKAAHILLEDVRLDMGSLLRHNRIVVREARNAEVMMKVTEKDLADYIAVKVKEARNPSVKIMPDKVELNSEVDLGIAKLAVGVQGHIVGDDRSIRFVSDKLEIKNAGGIQFGALFAEIPLVDMKRLPIPVGVRKVVTEPGSIILYADNHG